MILVERMPTFSYDPSRGRFRNYLLTYVHRNALKRLRRKENKLLAEYNEGQLLKAEEEEGGIDPEPFDDEAWKLSLLEQGLAGLRRDPSLDTRTFEVFTAYVLKQQPVAQVAADFELSENAVYQIKNRVRCV